jgi:ribosomal protein S18 acetylase RimI-like enzyme
VSIRDARPEDAEAIADIHVRTWQGAYGHVFSAEKLAGISVERRVVGWRRQLDEPPPQTHVLVSEDELGVRGFASCGPAEDDPALGELYAIYVLPEAWGAGHGRALMALMLGRLRAEDFPEAILWVLEDNPRTRRFYERGGWRLDGEPREVTFLDTPVRVVRYRVPL